MPSTALNSREVQLAFAEYDRQVTINNFKVACVLGMILMPVGILMDRHMYPELADDFLKLRFLSSVLIGFFLAVLLTPFGRKHYRFQGVTLFMVPASIIAWMIYKSPDGMASPYYAGLNLVMLVLAFVLHWTFRESFVAAALVVLLYLAASFFHGGVTADIGGFANNLFFLGCTVVIVVTGSYFHSKSRFREFAFRYELDKNKKALEQSNQKLDLQNTELADTLQKLTEAESQLVQQEKMASLGVMSAGIIHEINNPLNFATTGLYTLRKKGKYVTPDHQADFEDIVKDVEDGISRVKNIVSDLRMFTHPDTESLDEVEVSEAVTSALRFLSNEWNDKVRIEQKLPQHQTVRANKTKLIHVLTNLLQNSLDALREKSFNGEQPTIWIEGHTGNGASIVTVRDNGPGIASEHLGKVFDPFFTTKDAGDGMGLGLSICYRIIHESKGKISVHTEPEKFCQFTLEFPAKG